MNVRLLSIVLAAAAVPATASAQWLGNHQYDKGHGPAVAVNDANWVLEAHRSNNLQDNTDLWYHVGGLSPSGTVSWGASHKCDTGWEVAVAMNRKAAIEVHRSRGADYVLWFQAGGVDFPNKEIDWSGGHPYDKGQNPSVAVNNHGVVVEVHETDADDYKLWYHVGVLQTNADDGSVGITWGPSRQLAHGYWPSIAINDDGTVVEVHNNLSGDYNMDAYVGRVNLKDWSISWGTGLGYDNGYAPRVGLRNDGTVTEIHQSDSTGGSLWSHLGQVVGGGIDWDGADELTDGRNPSIGTNNTYTVEVHEGGNPLNDLWYDVRWR